MGSSGLADSLGCLALVSPRRHQIGPFRDRQSGRNYLSPQVRRLKPRRAVDTIVMNESGFMVWSSPFPPLRTSSEVFRHATIPGAGRRHDAACGEFCRACSSGRITWRALRRTDKGLSASCGGWRPGRVGWPLGPSFWANRLSFPIRCCSRTRRTGCYPRPPPRSLSLRVSGLVLGNVAPSESLRRCYPRRKGESSITIKRNFVPKQAELSAARAILL